MKNGCKSGKETPTPDGPLITRQSRQEKVEEMLKVKRGGRRALYSDTGIRSDVCGIRNVMSIDGSKGQATYGTTGNSRIKVYIKRCEWKKSDRCNATGRKLKIKRIFYSRAWSLAESNQYSLNVGKDDLFRFKSNGKSTNGHRVKPCSERLQCNQACCGIGVMRLAKPICFLL